MRLEELLHYFHVELKSAVAACMLPDEVVAFLANVDIAAAESFLPAEASKQCSEVLKANLKHFNKIKDAAQKKGIVVPKSKRLWTSKG